MSRSMRLVCVVLALTLGTAGAASAFPLTPGSAVSEERGDLLDRVLVWLASLATPAEPRLSSVWDNEGSQMDPDGQPACNGGITIDPDGGW